MKAIDTIYKCRRVLLALSGMALLAACQPEYTTYSGPEYVMFSDTLYTLPVQNDEEVFEIPVASTEKSSHDRTFGVEILTKRSNAIQGKHYEIENTSVTIPAGEMTGQVRIRGLYSNITNNDSLRLTLRLLGDERTEWNLYSNETAVMLQKCCPFDIYQFEGWAVMTSTYLMQYGTNSRKLVRIEIDPDNEDGLILKDYFYEGYDCKMTLKHGDPLNPVIKVDNQVFASTAQAFGTIYGNGKIQMTSPSAYTSYYNMCEGFLAHYMTLYVENVGTVGLFLNVLEMISEEEAAKLKREGL